MIPDGSHVDDEVITHREKGGFFVMGKCLCLWAPLA